MTSSVPSAGLVAGTGGTFVKRGSVFALGIRVVPLDSTGAPVPGSAGAYVTDNLVKIGFAVEYRAGIEAERVNGSGRACLYYQAPSTVKKLTISSLEVCYPDPDLEALLAGGVILSDSATPTPNHVGYAAPLQGSIPNPNGVAIEAWSNAVGNVGIDGTAPYHRWLFPRLWLEEQEQTIETAPMAMNFKGFGMGNPGYGNGAFNDWPYTSDRVFQHYQTAYAAPEDLTTNGYVTVPADGVTVGG